MVGEPLRVYVGARRDDDARHDALAEIVVRLAEDGRLSYGRMLEQRALDLARADLVAAGLDQVGCAATDKLYVAVCVTRR